MKNYEWVLLGLFTLFAIAGLSVMLGMLVWSFRLDADFTGRYWTPSFHHNFWSAFFKGAGLFLLGCLGIGGTLGSRTACRVGFAEFGLSLIFVILIIPFVDFEGWTGATAHTLAAVAFAGALAVLVPASFKWLWHKVSTTKQ